MTKARKITRRTLTSPPVPTVPAVATDRLLGDIRALIEAAREQTARAVNSALVGLYWHIGKRIREDVLGHKRAEYGQQIVSALSTQLTVEYGRGYTEKSLRPMIRFAEAFPDEVIVSALRRELSWTHFKEIMSIEGPPGATGRTRPVSLGLGEPALVGYDQWHPRFDPTACCFIR
jgi:hypothetical protein